MKWTAVEYDITKVLQDVHCQHFKIPSGMEVSLVIELEDAAYKRLSKDSAWQHRMQEKANAKVNPILEALKKKLKDGEALAAGLDKTTADMVVGNVNLFLKQKLQTAATEMATEVDKAYTEYKKNKSELHEFQIKSGGKIVVNAIGIAGAVAVTVVSGGGFGPPSIVGIVRGCTVILQEMAKLASNADQVGKLIQGELAILKKVMNEDLEKARKSGKIAQSVKEVGLQLLSAALGVETPNLKNCQSHLEVHKVDISKLEVESHKLASGIGKAMAKQQEWHQKFESAKGKMKPSKVTKIVAERTKSENALDQTLEATHKVNAAINKAMEEHKKFKKTLAAMVNGIPEWVNYVQDATSLVLDCGLSVAGANTVTLQALGAVASAEVDIGSLLIDKA